MKWHNKRVLVTGAAGFLGHHLIKALNELGVEIVALDNFSTGIRENLTFFNGIVIRADVAETDAIALCRLIQQDIDFIYHLGSPCSVILFNKNPTWAFNNTVGGFINIMEFAVKKQVKKVVYASSGSVYGRCGLPQSEGDTPKPVNLYGIAKLTCEKIASFYDDEVRSVGLRIFAGYGPGEEHKGNMASPVTIFLRSILNSQPPIVYGDGTQSRDFVYVDDVITALVRSAEKSVPAIINVGSGRSYTFNYVIELMNEMLGKNVKPRYIPKPVKYLERTQADIRLMKKYLGINPIPLEKGLEKYIEYVIQHSGFS